MAPRTVLKLKQKNVESQIHVAFLHRKVEWHPRTVLELKQTNVESQIYVGFWHRELGALAQTIAESQKDFLEPQFLQELWPRILVSHKGVFIDILDFIGALAQLPQNVVGVQGFLTRGCKTKKKTRIWKKNVN